MGMTKFLWLMYKGEGNLQHKIKEGYIIDLEVQKFLGEFYKSWSKLMDGLLKYKTK
jgi:hypothetical protein